MTAATSPKLLLTVQEAAAALSVGRTTVYEALASGRLASVKVGRSRRIPMAALEVFVASLGDTSGPDRAA
jgi:excisionase family DNA binding protein